MAESRHEIVSLLSDKLVSKQPYEGLLKGLNKDTLHTAVKFWTLRKVGCDFPISVVSIPPHAEFGP